MPKTSVLQFFNYTVEEIQFQKIEVAPDQGNFEISTQFNQQLVDCGDNNYDVKLSVKIEPSEEHPLPFKIFVSIVGHFNYNNANSDETMKQNILHQNTVAILFPFVRSIIASLTSTANVPALMLPIMDFSDVS